MILTAAQTHLLTGEFHTALEATIAKIRERATSQFNYCLSVNIPEDRVSADEAVENSIESGIVSAHNTQNGFAIESAVRLAHKLLEDVNAHGEARALLAAASKNDVNPFSS